MQFYAHVTRSEPKRWQLLKNHLLECYQLGKQYGAPLKIAHITGLAGLLHDLGKFSKEFQDYLIKASQNPDSVVRGSVDHSTAGAKLLYERLHRTYKNNSSDFQSAALAEFVGNAILAHHNSGGLLDFLNPDLSKKPSSSFTESPYLERVVTKNIVSYDQIKDSFQAVFNNALSLSDVIDTALIELENWYQQLKGLSSEEQQRSEFLLMKFIYSSLIDADRTDTMCFEQNQPLPKLKNSGLLFQKYYQNLSQALKKMNQGEVTPINAKRQKMSQQCDEFASKRPGIFRLSIPTGGGKTLASLRFALKHAVRYQQQRIIYVIPFTTIIEQNAAKIREILNGDVADESNILEFHSNVIRENNNENLDPIEENRLQLVQDNWDSPIILTTMVQFLDTLYGKGTQDIRRLHNLANSIIIFDEIQKVPTKCVKLFNAAINFLSRICHTTNVLCTATQPALDTLKVRHRLNHPIEMINNLTEIVTAFQRVNLVDQTRMITTIDDLNSFVCLQQKKVGNILVILNTKTAAKKLYQQLLTVVDSSIVFHLSTNMCAAHRQAKLATIESRLKQQLPTICVSTQLIEAGVDISFSCVIRSLAGLDSIAQAAGRCNRNGEVDKRDVFIIHLNSSEESVKYLPEIEVGGQILLDMLHSSDLTNINDLFQPQFIQYYFQKFYQHFSADLDYPIRTESLQTKLYDLMTGEALHQSLLSDSLAINLVSSSASHTIAKYFNVIDDRTKTVLVPYDSVGDEIITTLNGELNSNENLKVLLKKAQLYSVNIYSQTFEMLNRNHLIYQLQNGEILAAQPQAYDSNFGLDVKGDSDAGFGMNIFSLKE